MNLLSLLAKYAPLRNLQQRIRQTFSHKRTKSILPNGVAIVTTLNPENPERQVKALRNWQQLKSPVISLNVKTEQDKLVGQYPWIQFENPMKTADHIVGKPFVLFDSFLDWFSKNLKYSHIVILNSDISIPTNTEFWTSAVDLAGETLMFGNRTDVNFQNKGQNKEFYVGFDFFVLSRKLISCFPPSEFCLGAPWWDYWVPFVPLLQGRTCVCAKGAFAMHDWHETQWNKGLHIHYCREFISHARHFGLNFDLPDAVIANDENACKRFANRTANSILSLIYEKSDIVDIGEK